ncbi:MAG: hypothetical protein Q9N02_11915 [Ghiorsea sp.]|nr:hypothetical protein [Ghiorsea sp.]
MKMVSHAYQPPEPKQVAKPKPQLIPPRVNGFLQDKVIITNGKGFQILKVGDQKRDGWKLEVADSISVVFSHASGKTVKVSVRGVIHE